MKKLIYTSMIRAFEYQGQKCSAASRCIYQKMFEHIKNDFVPML